MIYEFKKIYSRGMLFLLLLCTIANGYLFYQDKQSRNVQALSAYDTYLEYLDEWKNTGILKEAVESPTSQEHYAYYMISKQKEYLELYPDYVLNMPDRAKASAKLLASGKSKFSERNISKTTRDFEGMEMLPLLPDRELGIQNAYRFVVSDLLALVFMLMVCVALFSKEYERKLYPLILAVPSRKKIALHKLIVLIISAILVSILIYGVDLFLSDRIFGFGDLNRPIQSLSEFRSCNLWISCREYLLLGYLIKLGGLIAFGILIFSLFVLLKKGVLVFLVLACFMAVSFGFYSKIPVTSNLNALHFINPFYLTDSFSIISHYQNINLFGYPCTMTKVSWVIFLFIAVLGCGIIIFRYANGSVSRDAKKIPFLSKIMTWCGKKLDRLNYHGNLFVFEAKKILIGSKGLWILFALVFLMFYNYQTAFRLMSLEAYAYKNYIERIGGRITDKTLEFIDEEYEFLERQDPATVRGQLWALPQIEMQVNTALYNEQEYGIEPYLIDETGFVKLFADKQSDIQDSLFVIVTAVLCCGTVFARENTFETKKLLRICENGKRLMYDKIVISLFISVLTVVFVNVGRYAVIDKNYLLSEWSAPVQSVLALSGIRYPISLGQYLLLIWVLRLLGGIQLGFIIAAVSSLCRNETTALAASMVVLAGPVLAVGVNVTILNYISVYPFLGGNLFLQEIPGKQITFVMTGVIAALLCIWSIRKNWESR